MAKKRVHELAKELNITSKELLAKLVRLGVKARSHASSVDEKVVKKLLAAPAKKAKPAPAGKPTPAAAKKKTAKPRAAKKKADFSAAAEKPATAGKPAKAAKAGKTKKTIKTEKKPAAAAEAPPVKGVVEKKPAKVKKTVPPVVEEENEEVKVPDRFKKELDTGKLITKFKGKPGMQRAFDTIKRVDTEKRWHVFKTSHKKHERKPQSQKTDTKPAPTTTLPRKRVPKFQEGTTVKEFAELLGQKLPDVMKKFMELGYMPTINQPLDADAAQIIAEAFGTKLEIVDVESEETLLEEKEVDTAALSPRPPIVTIMGHVDHGKTTLLDAIRKTNVTEMEAGGITQHIGAYKVKLKDREIVFLDTPGHEAFTMMRARGAKVTDIVVLVVAADDSVMPQTIEAIDHAKAANVPIIVAINKIDKPEANVANVKNELAQHDVVAEEWGGKNIMVEISAKQKQGLAQLLELVLLQADMLELKANYDRLARGTIIEARLDKGKGPAGTVLVNTGTLRVGDPFIVGTISGRVRALHDENGLRIEKAPPSTPVEVVGFPDVPKAGAIFVVMEDEKKARQIAMTRLHKLKTVEAGKTRKITLDDLYDKIKEGEIKDLNIIIKADVGGSAEAVKDALENLTHPEVQVKVIHASVGGINESDVMLATASNAIIIGFNIRPDSNARMLAEKEGVDIRLYNIIYEAVGSVKKALEGLLEPTVNEKILGRVEVRNIFTVSRIGTIAGCYVLEGMVSRASSGIRVIRDNVVIYDGKISSLKRFKDDAKEVQTGYECGITIENFNDIKVGDILENYVMEEVATKLE
ncbi:translation initiation factor IF-2 [bacterium BMS3Abin10]|nr:translation initiation factor IF-2 [bacterium BMS3Abin10]